MRTESPAWMYEWSSDRPLVTVDRLPASCRTENNNGGYVVIAGTDWATTLKTISQNGDNESLSSRLEKRGWGIIT